MKLFRLIGVFVAGLLLAQTEPDPSAVARKALDLILAEKYSDLFRMFSPQLQEAIPEASLAKIGATQVKPLGAPEKIGDPAVRKAGVNSVVTLPVRFAAQGVNFVFAINPAGQLYIMNLQPGEVTWQHPPYSKPDAFREREVIVGEGNWKLPGTLSVPTGNGPFPAVILVHDSGPLDRDETNGATRVFKDLSEGLSSRGIAVLRYEKRSRQFAARMAGIARTTIQDETVEDAVAAAVFLRTQKEIDPNRIYVVGHGLGGYISPRIAEDDPKLAGLVLLGANIRPLEDLMVERSESQGVTGKQLEGVKALAARVKALEPGDGDAPPILGMKATFLLDLKGYDPGAEMKKLTMPVLIIQGERDFQVTMKDFNLWKTSLAQRRDTNFRSYPALNHLLVPGEGKSTEAEYRKPGHVAPEVIDEIARFAK